MSKTLRKMPLDAYSYVNHIVLPFSAQTCATDSEKIYCEEYSNQVLDFAKKCKMPAECITESKFMHVNLLKIIVLGTKLQLDNVMNALTFETGFEISRTSDQTLEFTMAD